MMSNKKFPKEDYSNSRHVYIDVKNAMDKLFSEGRVVKDKSTHSEIDLKASPSIGNFITFNEDFLADLTNLKDSLVNYVKRVKVKRPFNILLIAPPGSGKSFLVKQLAAEMPEEENVIFEEYQVGTFYSTENLYDILRRIQSLNLEDKVPMVFLDEIDTQSDSQYIYQYLLAPMYDGKFYKGGIYSNLGKAILVFAISKTADIYATENLSHDIEYRTWFEQVENNIENIKETTDIQKYGDFLDRIDRNIFFPNSELNFIRSSRNTEAIYISIKLIEKHFDTTTIIEFNALSTIATMLLVNETRRKAEQAVFLSETPGATVFRYSYLPQRIRDQFDQLVDMDEKRRFRIAK